MIPGDVHRNLNSSNVLLDEQKHVKILGFGVSRPAPEKDINTNHSVGSDLWSAPEVLKNERFGTPADVFSFGMILANTPNHLVTYHSSLQV